MEHSILPQKVYPIEVICQNCGFSKYFFLPKGREVDLYLKKEICINCGCKIIKEKNKNGR